MCVCVCVLYVCMCVDFYVCFYVLLLFVVAMDSNAPKPAAVPTKGDSESTSERPPVLVCGNPVCEKSPRVVKKCAGCRSITYCDRSCQASEWMALVGIVGCVSTAEGWGQG